MEMKAKRLITVFTALVITTGALGAPVMAQGRNQAPTDPLGGKPPESSTQSVKDLDYQVKYHRAFEAVIWSMPAVAIYQLYRAAFENGAEENVVMAFSKPATAKAEFLTANNVTPYILSQTDLRNGPVVVEIPKATDKANLFGQIADHWQITIADIGPVGVDKGKGARILLLPPGYEKEIPGGYIAVRSPSQRIVLVFRSVPSPQASVEDAYAYAKTLKMYYLDDPRPTRFIDPSNMRYSTLPRYDERWFEDLYDIINVERAYPRDKVMTGMLATLGIEKGKPYKPNEKTRKAMRQAVVDAYHYMRGKFLTEYPPEELWWGTERQWRDYLYSDHNRGFEWGNRRHDRNRQAGNTSMVYRPANTQEDG